MAVVGTYEDKTAYAKYLKSKLCGDCAEGCQGCNEGCSEDKACDCCPAGLISLKDMEGNHIGCVTPSDAEQYLSSAPVRCQEGFVALYKEGVSPLFRGCVPADQFAALYAALNPG